MNVTWFHNARHKFVWGLDDIQPYVNVFGEIVLQLIIKIGYDPKTLTVMATPEIGFFPLADDENEIVGYALYIADFRYSSDRRRTLYALFREDYQIAVGAGFIADFFREKDILSIATSPERGQELVRRKRELVRNFKSIANKSWNRNRQISTKLRYQVLQRDNSTCQICGKRAPNVVLHLDHIKPISLDLSWRPSNNPDDYRILCQECNIGRGNLSWLIPE
jgi:5-methylcytosine-specific restriction endonuclease McrA